MCSPPATQGVKSQKASLRLMRLAPGAVSTATPRPSLQQCSLGPLVAAQAENRNATTALAHTLCMSKHRDMLRSRGMSTLLLQLLLTFYSLHTPSRRHARTCTPHSDRFGRPAALSRPLPLLRQMVAKPLSERLDKPAADWASSFEGRERAGKTGARIRRPNVAGAADVSAASPELASVARGAWTVPIRLPTAEVPVPSSYVRGVFSGPCGGERGPAVRISTEQSVLGVLGPGPMVGEVVRGFRKISIPEDNICYPVGTKGF